MSKQKLEQVLEYLINEEEEKARDLLHTVFVEKARSIHESLIEDEDEDIEEALDDKETDDEEVDESAKSDWEDEITQEDDEIARHRGEIDHEEEVGEADDEGDDIEDAEAIDDLDDMEIDGDEEELAEPEGDAEEAIPAKLDDLEAAVEELKAEFDKLMAGDEDVPAEDEMDDVEAEIGMGDELGMEVAPEEEAIRYESKEDDDAEELDEAAKLSAVKAAKMGDDGDASAKSVIGNQANNPGLSGGGEPVDFAGGDEKGGSADKPAEGMTTNQDAKLSAGPKAETGDKSDKGAGSLLKDKG